MKHEPKEGYVLLLSGELISIDEWNRRPGRKRKRRKGRCMKYFSKWEESTRFTKRQAARKERRKGPWDENA